MKVAIKPLNINHGLTRMTLRKKNKYNNIWNRIAPKIQKTLTFKLNQVGHKVNLKISNKKRKKKG